MSVIQSREGRDGCQSGMMISGRRSSKTSFLEHPDHCQFISKSELVAFGPETRADTLTETAIHEMIPVVLKITWGEQSREETTSVMLLIAYSTGHHSLEEGSASAITNTNDWHIWEVASVCRNKRYAGSRPAWSHPDIMCQSRQQQCFCITWLYQLPKHHLCVCRENATVVQVPLRIATSTDRGA